MRWTAREITFEFPRPMLVMGIINTTPDSFSDGGQFTDTNSAVDHALRLADEGADILDIGGESSRPGSKPVSLEEELQRVIPVVERLAKRSKILLSVDTQKPEVAQIALKAGASIINDIAANRVSPEMWQVVQDAKAGYVCMHMQGTPQTMQMNPQYDNVLQDIETFFHQRIAKLAEHGIGAEQVVLDPGIGFGKSLDHNIQLLKGLNKFRVVERPIMVGVSRKSFIEKLLSIPTSDRLPASLACAVWSMVQGASIVRVHDVAETVQAIRIAEALTDNS